MDFPWKVFSQTGNIETYLLMKEIETFYNKEENSIGMKEDMEEFDTL